MTYYTALDVSLRSISICIVDYTGGCPTSMCDFPARISFRGERSPRSGIIIVLDAETVRMAFSMRLRRRFPSAITCRTHTKPTTKTTSAAYKK